MPRRTPLEVFINAQTDRQAAYEKRRREQGLTKACAWIPNDLASDWKELARLLSKQHTESFSAFDLAAGLRQLVEQCQSDERKAVKADPDAVSAPAR